MTRFAPAPTGRLHLGHVANAIYVWGLARARGHQVLLRIEDHDRQRSRPEFEAQLLDDLDWLGFGPDRFPTETFRAGPCESRQSDRAALYQRAADALAARGLVYACHCSRQDLARAQADGQPPRAYPGTCRDLGLPLAPDVPWRVRLDTTAPPRWDDLLVPNESLPPASDSGDVVIRDRNGNWTYHFAVVVDDDDQRIDLVVRGLDLFTSTPVQLRLAALIGRATPPQFAHHPLVMRSATRKLSKSDGATGLAALRDAGWSARRLIGHAAHAVGLTSHPEPIAADEVERLFR